VDLVLNLQSPLVTLLGTDAYVERRQTAHKSQRKFSVEMLLSFRKLQSRSTSWSAVFDMIEKFMKCLNTNATIWEPELKRLCSVNSVLLVQVTSQVARTMFESAFDLFLLLSYLVGVGGQVCHVFSILTFLSDVPPLLTTLCVTKYNALLTDKYSIDCDIVWRCNTTSIQESTMFYEACNRTSLTLNTTPSDRKGCRWASTTLY
jgi:hypothetical protein